MYVMSEYLPRDDIEENVHDTNLWKFSLIQLRILFF